MAEESKHTYTIRIPEPVAMRIDDVARSQGIAPTTLLQSIINRKFKSRDGADRETEIAAETPLAAKLDTLRKRLELCDQNDRIRLDELRFEIVKTRAALLHSLDQTLSSSVVDQIIEASEQTAREYAASVSRDRQKWR
jgi:hypothetical protein